MVEPLRCELCGARACAENTVKTYRSGMDSKPDMDVCDACALGDRRLGR